MTETNLDEIRDPLARKIAKEFLPEVPHESQSVKRRMEIITKIIDAIPSERGISIHELSVKTGLGWSTVKDWLEIVFLVQESPTIHYCSRCDRVLKCGKHCSHFCICGNPITITGKILVGE